MATISLDIANARVPRVVAAVAKQMGVDATGFTGAQQTALMKAFYKQVTVDAVKAFELPTAATTATTTATAEIDTNISGQIT